MLKNVPKYALSNQKYEFLTKNAKICIFNKICKNMPLQIDANLKQIILKDILFILLYRHKTKNMHFHAIPLPGYR